MKKIAPFLWKTFGREENNDLYGFAYKFLGIRYYPRHNEFWMDNHAGYWWTVVLLTILFLAVATSLTAQINWKREILPSTCFFIAGALEGTAETLKWHYHEFDRALPNANPDFWDPHRSWANKYKGGDPAQGPAFFGSTTFLVWTTDGYHLARSSKNAMLMTGLLLTPDMKGQKWYYYLIKAGIYSLSYSAGFHLAYTLIFK